MIVVFESAKLNLDSPGLGYHFFSFFFFFVTINKFHSIIYLFIYLMITLVLSLKMPKLIKKELNYFAKCMTPKKLMLEFYLAQILLTLHMLLILIGD